jgi:putative Mn2+ efflux pump MntP
MAFSLAFFINSILFGVGLAMDAFSVSLANGLQEPKMRPGRMCEIAGTFAVFQILMPLIGWFCVRTAAERFAAFHRLIPWIALILLLYIGGKMLLEGIRGGEEQEDAPVLTRAGLMLQGIATSIDALSVGFTIADYSWQEALAEALIIGVVTFGICIAGLKIGKRFGMKLAGKASILGGVILVAIGLEIFLKGVVF